MTSSRPVDDALTTLRQRWGTAAPRSGREAFGEVVGSLATVPLPDEAFEPARPEPDPGSEPRPVQPLPATEPLRAPSRPAAWPDGPGLAAVVPTGFPELDAILGPGGVPRSAGLALCGEASSGRTTLALRLVAEAQATGSIVAYVDLERAFDPVEAVARGIRLEWLVVVAPASVEEALAMAGALLQGRAVDLLLLDLPPRLGRSARLADALGRLTAFARRAGALLVVLEPPGHGSDGSLDAGLGLRLELRRRAWIRLGRDVVGQRTEVEVARSRFGPPGRRAEVRILYADGGPRDRCLRRSPLLDEGPPGGLDRLDRRHPDHPRPSPRPTLQETVIDRSDATPPPLLAPPAPPARADALGGRGEHLRLLPGRSPRPRRTAVGGGDGARRRSRGADARGPARDAARSRPPARA